MSAKKGKMLQKNHLYGLPHNKTFRGETHNTSFNACVGENGWNDTYTYADGYLEAADHLLEELHNKSMMGSVDIWVYPILFSARHGLELVLKAVMNKASSIRPEIKIDLTKVYITHDLAVLWEELKDKLAKIDRRFIEYINKLDEHVNDYAEIDPTGQVFRYPDDRDTKTQHLDGSEFVKWDKPFRLSHSSDLLLIEKGTALGKKLVKREFKIEMPKGKNPLVFKKAGTKPTHDKDYLKSILPEVLKLVPDKVTERSLANAYKDFFIDKPVKAPSKTWIGNHLDAELKRIREDQ